MEGGGRSRDMDLEDSEPEAMESWWSFLGQQSYGK